MKKKVIRLISEFSNREITLTIDDKLKDVDEKKLAPRKLEQANRDLKGIKLPSNM
jgi:hypothetical protein